MSSAIRWTPEQLTAHLAKMPKLPVATGLTKMQALGRLKSGSMNQTEQAYSLHLEALKQAGEVVWFKFEGLKFRLADKTFYTPDFAVLFADGRIEIHEVKGYWTDDARVKIKVAAGMYPFQFIAVKKSKLGWEKESF